MLRFEGAAQFRQRIVLSTLSGRPIRIDKIREAEGTDASQPSGLQDFEGNFLRLLEKFVNGCEIRINETATTLRYTPGIIIGGEITHDCGTSRGIGYFVQPLLMLAPFAKQSLEATLTGVTNEQYDVGTDLLRTITLPMLRHFGLPDASLRIIRRGAPPKGGGELQLSVPVVRELNAVELTEQGRFKRVRGVAYGSKVSPQLANRMVEATRGVLNNYLPDVWVYTDLYKGKASGNSAGFALSLVAESTSGSLLGAEVCGVSGALPEDVGLAAASALLEEVRQGGAIDSYNQSLALTLMCLSAEDVSRVRTGPLTEHSIGTLRLLRDFFGVSFQISADAADDSVLLVCRGVGFRNMSKRTT